jgi:hemoglobin-like flavoprotein
MLHRKADDALLICLRDSIYHDDECVGALDERELFQSIISHSGRQHSHFGVNSDHFIAFGDALISSLEQQFGAAFTPELRAAWITLYDAVQTEMIRAGERAA